MTETTYVEPEAEIDAATCPRCSSERLQGVPFCTTCNLRFALPAPVAGETPRRRLRGGRWRLLLLMPVLAAAAVAAMVLLG